MEGIKRVLLARRRVLALVILLRCSVYQFFDHNDPGRVSDLRQGIDVYLEEYADAPWRRSSPISKP